MIAKGTPHIFMLSNLPKPGASGIEITAKICQIQNGKSFTPIIALTADITEATKKECLLAGVNEVVTKPIDTSVLKAILQRYLNK